MSEQMTFDRAKGFVALPIEVLDLDLNPGAFRLLVELCRMANLDGYCWPSLEQLGDRLGRSRAAISGYISELRAEGLLETERQRTANGYNYRLKYRVTFWQDWRADLRGSTDRKPKRRVQQIERPKEENQNHINQDPAIDDVLMNWAHCFKGAPYPSVAVPPDHGLVHRSQALVTCRAERNQNISADIISELQALWRGLSVECDDKSLRIQRDLLAQRGFEMADIAALKHHITRAWPHHWRHAPDEKTWDKLVSKAGISTASEKIALLKTHLRRWATAQKTLQPTTSFGHLGARPDAVLALK